MASSFQQSPGNANLQSSNRETKERFFDLQFELDSTLRPIDGYQNAPSLPLEDSLSRVEHQLHDLRRYIRVAKRNCHRPIPNGLTLEESAAIRLYTMEWSPLNKCLYHVLNQCLRDRVREKLKPWFAYLKLLITALYRLQPRPQLVYRGVKGNLTCRYREGDTAIWWGFSSCTTSLRVLGSELYLGTQGVRTLFYIECLSGRDISHHSDYSNEGEVLLLPGRQFKVKSTLRPSHDLFIIHLKEEVPSEPLIVPPFLLPEVPSSDSFLSSSVRCANKELNDILHQGLPKLEVGGMKIGDNDMRYIVQSVRSNPRCVYIDLSSNTFSQDGVQDIEVMLTHNGYIETLILDQNHLSDIHLEIIVRGLRHHNTLVELSLDTNDITDIGLHCIVEFLQQNDSLRSLNLNSNNISDSGPSELSDVLSHRQFLRELYLSNNRITNISIDAIIHMLKKNQSLVRFDLDNNLFTENEKRRLREEAMTRHQLAFGT